MYNGEFLFHYTSMDAFYGMIHNQELWLSETVNMSDKSEGRQFIYNLEQEIKKNCKLNDRLDCIVGKLKLLFADSMYAMCFTDQEEDAAQWERYADNASGVCIRIKRETVEELCKTGGFVFSKVLYERDVKKEKYYSILREYVDNGVLKDFDKIEGYLSNLAIGTYCRKDYSFRNEREYRMLSISDKELCGCAEAVIEYELINHCIKRIMKLNYKLLCEKSKMDYRNIFDAIIIGPRSQQNVDVLKDFLYMKGLETLSQNISKSTCPLALFR